MTISSDLEVILNELLGTNYSLLIVVLLIFLLILVALKGVK